MKKLIQVALLAFLVGLTTLSFKLCSVVDHLNASLDNVDKVTSTLNVTASQFAGAGKEAKALIQETRKPVRKILVHADEFMGRGARAMQKVEASASDLHDQQQEINKQEVELFASVQSTLEDVDGTVVSARTTLDDADNLITNPHLDHTLAHVDNISGDFETRFHDFLFPPPYTGRFKTLHKVYVVGKGVVGIAAPGAEFGYYLSNIK